MSFRAWTLVAKSTKAILLGLENIKRNIGPSSEFTSLFCLSSNIQPSKLEALVEPLRSLTASHVGCISAPEHEDSEEILCSVALFPSKSCVSWRSHIDSSNAIQVGRWHPPNKSSSTSSTFDLPSELPLSNQQNLSTLLFLTDGEPTLLSSLLSKLHPSATQLALRASRTIFLTGRSFTLFHDGQIRSSGSVGIGVQIDLEHRCSAPGLTCLSPPLLITKSSGNLIHELRNRNPGEIVKNALHQRQSIRPNSSDERVLVAVSHNGQEFEGNNSKSRVYEVIAGGPSKGTILLDGEVSNLEGNFAQIMICDHGSSSVDEIDQLRDSSITFGVSTDLESLAFYRGGRDMVAHTHFRAFSEELFGLKYKGDCLASISPMSISKAPSSRATLVAQT